MTPQLTPLAYTMYNEIMRLFAFSLDVKWLYLEPSKITERTEHGRVEFEPTDFRNDEIIHIQSNTW